MIILDYEIPVSGKFLLTGSRALGNRIAKDVDLICHSSQLIGTGWEIDDRFLSAKKDKFDVILTDNHPTLDKLLSKFGKLYPYTNHRVLFILKSSHIHLPRKNWFRDIEDYHYLKRILGNEFSLNHYIDSYRKELDTINSTHTMKLNVSKNKFFDDGVKKYIDHDRLHEIFAHYETPIYTKTQKPNNEVFCSLELWDKLSQLDRIRMVLEETYVIAAERFIIPKFVRDEKVDTNLQLILNALKKVCTTLSSGWFREFSIENYFEICNNINMVHFNERLSKVKLEVINNGNHEARPGNSKSSYR